MPTSENPTANTLATGGTRLRSPVVRIVLGVIATAAPVIVTMDVIHVLVAKPLRVIWPHVLASALCVAGYRLYIRLLEERPLLELARRGAFRGLGAGLALGLGLSVGTIGILVRG
jgi:hypothetical protein